MTDFIAVRLTVLFCLFSVFLTFFGNPNKMVAITINSPADNATIYPDAATETARPKNTRGRTMTNIKTVQEAIRIRGYITVSVGGTDRQCRAITVGEDGTWITDILTADLKGHARIKKTKADVVRRAKWIVEHRDEIAAERKAADERTMDWARNS